MGRFLRWRIFDERASFIQDPCELALAREPVGQGQYDQSDREEVGFRLQTESKNTQTCY